MTILETLNLKLFPFFFFFFPFILETLICYCSSTTLSPLLTEISYVLCRAPCVSVQSGTQWRVVGYMMCVCCAIVHLSVFIPMGSSVGPCGSSQGAVL